MFAEFIFPGFGPHVLRRLLLLQGISCELLPLVFHPASGIKIKPLPEVLRLAGLEIK